MIPKSRKEILNICQSNFSNYSTLSKIFIIFSILLSAAVFASYICGYIVPTLRDIISGEIVGWNVIWRICLGVILYYVSHFANIFCISIGGAAICREENWDHLDFAKAWVDMYEYEKYLEDEEINDENSEK
jgi:hypothetical protein